MTNSTEGMDPCDACKWYYENRAAGLEMEWHICKSDPWQLDDGYFTSYRIYRRLKKRVLRSGRIDLQRYDSDGALRTSGFRAIEDPGPDAVILSRMPTRDELRYKDVTSTVMLLQSLALEVDRD